MKNYNFYKWRIWIILAFSFVMALFHRSALGAISSDVSKDLGLTASQLSNLVSLTFYTYAMMQIPSGLLLDRLGYKKMSMLGMLTTGMGSIFFAFAHHVIFAYIGRFLIGLGTSVIFISILNFQQIWFKKEDFTKASGLLSFIGNIGGVIATFPLALLAVLMGWRSSMFFMGLLCIVVSCLIFFFTASHPKNYGLIPLSIYEEPSQTKVSPSLLKSLKEVLINPHTWRNFFILFTLVSCTTTLTGLWGIRYLETVYEMTSTKASFYIAFVIYGLIIGSLCVNKIATFFGDKLYLYPRISCGIMSLFWLYILVVAKGKPSLIILIIVFFMMGFIAMSHILAFTDMTQHVSSENNGLASSVVNSGEFLGSSLISLIIGSFLDLSWHGELINGVRFYNPQSYTLAFSVFLIISLLGIATSFIGVSKKRH